MIDYLLGRLMAPLRAFLMPEDRLYWLYLLTAFMIAGCGHGSLKRLRLSKLKLYFFSLRASALADYRFFVINRVIFGLLFSPIFLVLDSWIANACEDYLSEPFTVFKVITAESLMGNAGWSDLALTILTLIAIDLAFFLSHRLQHSVPALWEFHQVHHSAEALSPFTAYRVHPVDDILSLTLSALLMGMVEGCFNLFTAHSSHIFTWGGVHIGLIIFYLAGFNARHSRAWVSYGLFWGHWLISPVQHQIHHSLKPEHFNKNFGFIFACWDRLCGTLYVPTIPKRIQVGLEQSTDHDGRHAVWFFYIRPFIALWHRPRSRPVVVLITLLLTEVIWVNASAAYQALLAKSVFLEDLSSPEVKQLISSGFDTLLIPTGGIEQNGSHMALGKHNFVMRYTSERIASELGHTLVAPLISIVPEGRFDHPTGHMQWAGTLGLSPQVFESVLIDMVHSASVHGFHYVCFIGEHGESQASQTWVAEKINQEGLRASQQMYALNVDAYYQDDEQRAWLIARGETEETMGHHAGIIDTSEMMAVDPSRVWMSASLSLSSVLGPNGSDGMPSHASAFYGQVFLRLKIKHAVTQIQHWKARLPK